MSQWRFTSKRLVIAGSRSSGQTRVATAVLIGLLGFFILGSMVLALEAIPFESKGRTGVTINIALNCLLVILAALTIRTVVRLLRPPALGTVIEINYHGLLITRGDLEIYHVERSEIDHIAVIEHRYVVWKYRRRRPSKRVIKYRRHLYLRKRDRGFIWLKDFGRPEACTRAAEKLSAILGMPIEERVREPLIRPNFRRRPRKVRTPVIAPAAPEPGPLVFADWANSGPMVSMGHKFRWSSLMGDLIPMLIIAALWYGVHFHLHDFFPDISGAPLTFLRFIAGLCSVPLLIYYLRYGYGNLVRNARRMEIALDANGLTVTERVPFLPAFLERSVRMPREWFRGIHVNRHVGGVFSLSITGRLEFPTGYRAERRMRKKLKKMKLEPPFRRHPLLTPRDAGVFEIWRAPLYADPDLDPLVRDLAFAERYLGAHLKASGRGL